MNEPDELDEFRRKSLEELASSSAKPVAEAPGLNQHDLADTETSDEKFDKEVGNVFENATEAVELGSDGSALEEFVFDANGDGPFDWNQWDATDPPPPNEHSGDNAYGRNEFHPALDIRGEEKDIDDAKTAPSVAKPESAIGGVDRRTVARL